MYTLCNVYILVLIYSVTLQYILLPLLNSSSQWFIHLPVFLRCLQAEEGERLQLEYTQQLLLGGLLSICRHLTSLGIEEARGIYVYICVCVLRKCPSVHHVVQLVLVSYILL